MQGYFGWVIWHIRGDDVRRRTVSSAQSRCCQFDSEVSGTTRLPNRMTEVSVSNAAESDRRMQTELL